MTGRLIGTRELSLAQIETIVKLTNANHSKREIANAVNCDPSTVYRLQSKLDLI